MTIRCVISSSVPVTAGAGNTQTEVLCAVLKRMGYDTGISLYDIQDVAEDLVEPTMRRPQVIRTDSIL